MRELLTPDERPNMELEDREDMPFLPCHSSTCFAFSLCFLFGVLESDIFVCVCLKDGLDVSWFVDCNSFFGGCVR